MKLHLVKVRLNKGGYDFRGEYWGVGLPLYYYQTPNCEEYGHIRANNREHAKQLVRSLVPSATFFR